MPTLWWCDKREAWSFHQEEQTTKLFHSEDKQNAESLQLLCFVKTLSQYSSIMHGKELKSLGKAKHSAVPCVTCNAGTDHYVVSLRMARDFKV